MRALLYKDFILIKKVAMIFLAIFVAATVYSVSIGAILETPLYFVLFSYFSVVFLFNLDVKENVNLFLVTTPLKRNTLVLSRYVFVWIISLLSITTMTIALLFYQSSISLKILLAVYAFVSASIAGCSIIPIILKFGAPKSSSFLIVTMAILFIPFSKIEKIFGGKIENLEAKLANISIPSLILIIIIIGIIINLISYIISVKIISNKEF